MEIEILDSSPKAIQIAQENRRKGKTAIYPFDQLTVGKSFKIDADKAKVASLRSIAHRKSKQENKQFVVVEHKDAIPPCVEVARVA